MTPDGLWTVITLADHSNALQVSAENNDKALFILLVLKVFNVPLRMAL